MNFIPNRNHPKNRESTVDFGKKVTQMVTFCLTKRPSARRLLIAPYPTAMKPSGKQE